MTSPCRAVGDVISQKINGQEKLDLAQTGWTGVFGAVLVGTRSIGGLSCSTELRLGVMTEVEVMQALPATTGISFLIEQ